MENSIIGIYTDLLNKQSPSIRHLGLALFFFCFFNTMKSIAMSICVSVGFPLLSLDYFLRNRSRSGIAETEGGAMPGLSANMPETLS